MTKQQNHTRIQELEVENWNLRHPVGAEVEFTNDSGEVKRTTTKSEAFMLSGHTAVVSLKGISGCYLLSRVKVVS